MKAMDQEEGSSLLESFCSLGENMMVYMTERLQADYVSHSS